MSEKRFINDGYPKTCDKISVIKQSITLMQENDTMGDSDKLQQLNIETVGVDYDPKENRDFFFRVTTGDTNDEAGVEKFWSVEGPEEFVEIFNEVAKRTDMSVRWELKKVFLDEKEKVSE